MITRREVLKHMVVSVGGSALLSACGGRVTLDPIAPGEAPRFYSEREMAVLSRVSDLLIPRTETPGAVDARVPALIDQLMAEWASADTRAAHRATLSALDARLAATAGGDFVAASGSEAVAALTEVDAAAFADRPIDGYAGLKGLIHQMYFATEPGALDEQGWVAVPGRWDPCAEITT